MKNLKVTTEAGSDGKMFAVHAADCADLAKRRVIANASDITEALQEVANCYGGYGDNGDQPKNEADTRLWTAIKACTRKPAAAKGGAR